MLEAVDLDAEATAARALELVETDDILRSDILSIGIAILLPDEVPHDVGGLRISHIGSHRVGRE